MKVPMPLLIIVTVVLLGITAIAVGPLSLLDRIEDPDGPHTDFRLGQHVQELLEKPRRSYLVASETPFSQPERPAPFSVHPRLNSVPFML